MCGALLATGVGYDLARIHVPLMGNKLLFVLTLWKRPAILFKDRAEIGPERRVLPDIHRVTAEAVVTGDESSDTV
jgi:hypothetical protein